MDRSVARRLLAAGLLLGVLAEVVLDGPAFGLNVVIVVAALLGAGWLLRRRGRAPDPLDAWLPITAVALAAFVAIRGDPFMATVDTIGALAFAGASMVALSGLAVTRRSASVVAVMAAMTAEATVAGPARVVRAFRPAATLRSIRLPAAIAALGRGLLLATPDRGHVRDPVRVRRSDLPADDGRPSRLAARPRRAPRASLVRRRLFVARGGAALGVGRRDPGDLERLSRGCGTDRHRRAGGTAWKRRGVHRAGRHQRRGGPLRRPPDRVLVRWPEHDPGRRDDLQRLRAARVLRVGRGGLPGGRRCGRPGGDCRPAKPAVPRRAPRSARPDGDRARVGGASLAPLPGRLWVDRAAAVRPHHDHLARGGPHPHDRRSLWRIGCAGWGTAWRSSGSWRWWR